MVLAVDPVVAEKVQGLNQALDQVLRTKSRQNTILLKPTTVRSPVIVKQTKVGFSLRRAKKSFCLVMSCIAMLSAMLQCIAKGIRCMVVT